MSRVVGVDLSTFAVELVSLEETTNTTSWHHIHLEGPNALERLRSVPRNMPRWTNGYWDDVYLVAVEMPMSHGQPGTLAKLSRVFGAVMTCVPPRIEVWEVDPQAWRVEISLSAGAKKEICAARCVELGAPRTWADQNAYDAYAVARFARAVNERGLRAA